MRVFIPYSNILKNDITITSSSADVVTFDSKYLIHFNYNTNTKMQGNIYYDYSASAQSTIDTMFTKLTTSASVAFVADNFHSDWGNLYISSSNLGVTYNYHGVNKVYGYGVAYLGTIASANNTYNHKSISVGTFTGNYHYRYYKTWSNINPTIASYLQFGILVDLRLLKNYYNYTRTFENVYDSEVSYEINELGTIVHSGIASENTFLKKATIEFNDIPESLLNDVITLWKYASHECIFMIDENDMKTWYNCKMPELTYTEKYAKSYDVKISLIEETQHAY